MCQLLWLSIQRVSAAWHERGKCECTVEMSRKLQELKKSTVRIHFRLQNLHDKSAHYHSISSHYGQSLQEIYFFFSQIHTVCFFNHEILVLGITHSVFLTLTNALKLLKAQLKVSVILNVNELHLSPPLLFVRKCGHGLVSVATFSIGINLGETRLLMFWIIDPC